MSKATFDAAVWDSITQYRGRGEEIAALVEPLLAGELALAPPLPDLDERLAAVLAGLGRPAARIVRQSVDDAVRPIARMNIGEAERFVGGLCGLLTGCIETPLGRLIDGTFRARAKADRQASNSLRQVGDYVLTCLVAAKPDAPSIPKQFLRAMHGEAGIRSTALYLALATAFDLEGVDVIRAIARLYLDGNFPIGLQRDGAFVVLVR